MRTTVSVTYNNKSNFVCVTSTPDPNPYNRPKRGSPSLFSRTDLDDNPGFLPWLIKKKLAGRRDRLSIYEFGRETGTKLVLK